MIKLLTKKFTKHHQRIPGPPGLPILGNLWSYKLGIEEQSLYHENLEKLHKKYGSVVRQKLGPETVVHLFSPEDISKIYSKEGKYPVIKPLQEAVQLLRNKSNIAQGLGASNGEEWYNLRASVKTVLLTPVGIERFVDGTDKATNELIRNLKIKAREDYTVSRLMTLFGAWSLEAAGSACFGRRLGYLEENEKNAIKMIMANRSTFYMATHLKFSSSIFKHIALPKWKTLESTEISLIKAIEELTDETIQLASTNEDKADANSFYLLKTLIGNKNLTKKQIYVLLQSLMLDGLSTIVPVLTNSLYILATNPVVQSKAYEELSQHLSKDSNITTKNLKNLPYLRGLIKETFRLRPNGTEISRVLQKPMNLSGYQIDAGTHVNFNMNVHFHSSNAFSRPLEVIPERWIKGTEKHKANPFIVIPFGHGTRTCVGRKFAEQSLRIALAKIILNFTLKYKNDVEPLQQIYNILMFPSDTRGLIFEPRN